MLSAGLFAAWALLLGAVVQHQRAASIFKGSSRCFVAALQASTVLGFVMCLLLLGLYGYRVSWAWAAAMLVVGIAASTVAFGLIERLLGQLVTNVLCFMWPVPAVLFYLWLPS